METNTFIEIGKRVSYQNCASTYDGKVLNIRNRHRGVDRVEYLIKDDYSLYPEWREGSQIVKILD